MASGHPYSRRPSEPAPRAVAAALQAAVQGGKPCTGYHFGQTPVTIGDHEVWAAGTGYGDELPPFDLYVPLDRGGLSIVPFGSDVLSLTLPDFGGAHPLWGETLIERVVPAIEAGKRVVGFCMGSHGRTGLFLASLIALLEPDCNDPVAAMRQRHCIKAVETRAQLEAAFALAGKPIPAAYAAQFRSDGRRIRTS